MKRILSVFVLLTLILSLSGCKFWKRGNEDTVTFYYQRVQFSYGTEDSVIGSETRDISGHTGDLSYLLALYLVGPTNEDLISPFPKNTRLLSAVQEENTVNVELSGARDFLSDSEFTLACACLTLTCLELTDAVEVTIIAGEQTLTMNRDNMLLFDEVTAADTTGG